MIPSVEARFRVLKRDFECWGRDFERESAISNVEARFRVVERGALNFGLSPGEVDFEKRLSPKTRPRVIG